MSGQIGRLAFRDSGRGPTHHRGGPALPLWTPCRLQEQLPPQRGHITVHARSHRTTISPQCENHRWRHATRQPPGGIPGADQTSRKPPRGLAQHNTSHPHHNQPTCSLPPTPPGTRLFGCYQGQVQRHAAGWHRQTRQRPMVVRPPSRAKEGQRLEVLWRLLSPEHSHHPRQVSSTTHTRLLPPPFWLHHLLQDWLDKSLPSNPCPPCRHLKDSNYHTLWPFWISFYVLWPM